MGLLITVCVIYVVILILQRLGPVPEGNLVHLLLIVIIALLLWHFLGGGNVRIP